MLYLDEVVIHNFKSFKHSTIKFNQGFNCIVGPNGSGKSNICDSLLFALGETSLKRMRVNSSAQLINNSAKPVKDENVKKAYVRVKFAGDKEIEITRAIKSNKKVGYRLNGKRVTRQEVVEVLRGVHGNINETNTMTQGEITYLLTMSAKERRELIDVTAGIKEFNEKRDVSLKELEKVDQKINDSKLILSERSGFLNDLEKEKEDAEKYIDLSNNIKQTSYTLLKLREKEVETRFSEAIRLLNERGTQKQKIEKEIVELDIQISSLLSEKDKLSKNLNAKSAEAGSTNKILEEVNKNIAVNNTQLISSSEIIKNTKDRIEILQGDLRKLKAKDKENQEVVKRLDFELEVKNKNLPEHIGESDFGTEAGGLTERYNENYKKMEELEKKLLSSSSEYAQYTSEYENLNKNVMDMHKSMNEFGSKRSTLTTNIKSSKDALSSLQKSKSEVEKDLTKETATLKELNERLGAIYSENVNLRDVLAQSGRTSDKSYEVLKKEITKGFHGRAQDICTFDDKYAIAVQSAAGGRFGYFVVDTIDVANAAINELKAKKLGRASFIPIKEIAAKEQKAPAGLKPVLDYVKFDKKFDKVFAYIFSNTYVVDSIKDAQKIGIGNYRFVTVEGDLVEPSGIVSGGSVKTMQSITLVENKLKKLEIEKKDVTEKINEANATLEMVRKKIANYDTEIMNYDIELKHSLEYENDANRNMDQLNDKVKHLETRIKELKDKTDVLRAEKGRAENSIKLFKEENVKLRLTIDGMIAGKGKSARSKEDAAKLKSLREEVEKLKIGIASTNKENDMIKSRSEELDKEIKEAHSTLATLNAKATQLEKELGELKKQKAEHQTNLETHDKKTSGLFKEIQVMDDKISKLGFDKGKFSSETERISRDAIEIEGRKAQMQTRLNDIKAELLSYSKMEIISDANTEALEKQLIITKDALEKLGAVNLKAPEMYELKKKDVDQAHQKMETLENEKNSILSMIEQIEQKKLGVFTETFNAVNENFKQLYGYIFEGSANLYLINPKDPFNSGLDIDVMIKGKKHNPNQLSGGQKSLITLTLVFAIQMRMPMSFYVFDEIDIALDKENSKKLSKLIKELSEKSQFIVVSHNDSLISAADTAIGVVNKANESQVVGIQLASK
jgi:chromosome segregation protein